MDFDLVLGGLAVGVVIGLTRMSGGARTVPMLVIFFGVSPLTAVSCDLVTAAAMNPIRAAPPARRAGNGELAPCSDGWRSEGRMVRRCAARVELEEGHEHRADHAGR